MNTQETIWLGNNPIDYPQKIRYTDTTLAYAAALLGLFIAASRFLHSQNIVLMQLKIDYKDESKLE